SNAFLVDVAFSASTLAAPIVAAMSMGTKVLSSTLIANIPHVTAELTLEPSSAMTDKSVESIEREFGCKVLARTPAGAPTELPPDTRSTVRAGDALVIHAPSAQLATLASAARGTALAGV